MDILVPDPWWQEEFSPCKVGLRARCISRDGKTLLKVQRDPMGARALHVGVMRLALSAARRPEIRRACLVMAGPRLSRERLLREWRSVRPLFSFEIACRLSMVAIDREGFWTEPEDEYLLRIGRALQPVLSETSHVGCRETRVKAVAGQKQLEVMKVLLHRWLRRERAIPIGRLAEQVGCTYPTVAQALKRLERGRNIIRHSNRSVELGKFPREAWNELIAVSSSMRQSFRYEDASGERPDPQSLLRRLDRMKPPGVAVSGVVAARFWHPDFDLHGMPRLDLVLHAPQGRADLAFMRRLDPALRRVEDSNQSAIVVLHPLARHDPLFEGEAGSALPLADPVETVLDLQELGLTVQAGQLMTHFRPDARWL